MTRCTIDSLLAQDIPVTVFAIDNGSEGLHPVLSSYGKHISTISHVKRHSLSSVWNEALSMAFDSLKLEYALVVNNDVELRPETYRLLLADGASFVTAVGVRPREHMASLPDELNRSPHPDFSCFLMRSDVWKRTGKFDERIHAYTGDCDYHLRMHRAGIEAFSIPVPFYHASSGTLSMASPDLVTAICQEADADRAMFKHLYGFEAGSPAYYQEFSK